MESLKAISQLPGFGFHPTDAELISYYLKRKVHGLSIDSNVISEVDIYKHEPWDLPAQCKIPTRDSKWHFFTSRDRKYPNGLRSNRATEAGYWKSTGKDRNIKLQSRVVGSKKTLVFHEGRPPAGKRTDWIMHEYYIAENECRAAPLMKDVYVLCRVTKRNGLPLEGDNLPQPEEVDNHPQQLYEAAESGICNEPTSPPDNVDNLDAWLNELLDPDFSGIALPEDQKVEQEEGVTSAEPKSEPVDFSVEQNILDDEDFYNNLYFNPDDFFNNFPEDPTMGNADASFPPGNWLPESNYNFAPATILEDEIAKNEEPELFISRASTQLNENNDTGIRIRKRHKKVEVSDTRIKLQVQLHKMETREAESVNQSIKLVDYYSHVDLVKELVESKDSPGSDDSQKSGTLFSGISGIRRVIRGFFVPLRGRSSAGSQRSFLGVFTVAILGLILYLLFR